jgi:hypothetical protein
VTSRNVSASVSQAPRVHVAPSRPEKTYGDLAGDFSADYGLEPDPWQRIVLDDWLAVHRGRWASLTCGLAVPRQNGKNALIEIRELFGMVGRGEKILHTAHEIKTARKAFRRLQFFFGTQRNDPAAKYPELNALVEDVRNVNGQEAIYLKNGGSVEVVARSKNSGRGFTVDILVMDEAQEMSEEDLEALMPTTSAAPKGDPQWIFTGTPPGPTANGEIFTRVRSEALAGRSKRLAWHEWSPPPTAEIDDRGVWIGTNPATVAGRLQMEVIEGERARFSEDGFWRERLGRWDESESASAFDPFPLAAWNARARDVHPSGPPQFFITVEKSQRSAYIAVAADHDGVPHVGEADYRPGVAWLTGRVRELKAHWPNAEFGAYSAGPVKAWAPLFAEFDVELELLSQPQSASAFAHMKKLVDTAEMTHSPTQVFADALKGAAWREGNAGAFDLDWRKSEGDPGPFAAAAGALWLLESVPQLGQPSVYYV